MQRLDALVASESGKPSGHPNMEELLTQAGAWKNLQRGELVGGVVMGVGQDSLLVHFGGKLEGVVPLQEMRTLSPEALRSLQPGAQLLAYVLRPESEDGPALLSLDRARGEQAWQLLQRCLETGQSLEGRLVGFNKGGAMVDVEGVQGFVPHSHLAPVQRGASPEEGAEGAARRIGKTIQLKVLELDRKRGRVILSEKVAWQAWREEQRERLVKELREGETRRGRVTSIANFGAFVDLGGAEGLIHVSELSWGSLSSPEDAVKVGDEVEVYVLKVDVGSKRISLSLRRVQPDGWAALAGKYRVGQTVSGTVTRVTPFGAFVRVDGGLEGLVHVSELSAKPVQDPSKVVKEGDQVEVKVLRIEPERRRLGLSLKQAQEEM